MLPGDTISLEQNQILEATQNVFRLNESSYVVTTVSLLDVEEEDGKRKVRIIPLKGKYMPKENDLVIGVVVDTSLTAWYVDIRAPYIATLSASDYLGKSFNPVSDNVRRYLDVGDVVVAKIAQFDRTRGPLLTVQDKGLGKVLEGALIEVDPCKVARIIGKRRSMLSMLQEETKCDILVGNNGRLLLRCPNPELEYIAVLAIRKIEAEAHTIGLTERIKEFIITEKVKRGLIRYEIG